MELRQLVETEHKRFYANKGTEEIPTYEVRLTNNGHKVLKKTGTRNIYNQIQEAKDECDVLEINRRAIMGDPNAIQKIQNTGERYGDMTTIPTSILEAKQMIIDVEKAFNELPINVRKEFNNSVDEFMAGTTNGKVKEVFEKIAPKKQEVEKETTTEITTNKEQVL